MVQFLWPTRYISYLWTWSRYSIFSYENDQICTKISADAGCSWENSNFSYVKLLNWWINILRYLFCNNGIYRWK